MSVSSANSTIRTEFPPVDERLIAPNTGYEIDDGELVKVPPSDEVHGVNQCALGSLLRAHRASDREVATDMLTRLTERDDMAPDASVYPSARDRVTGGRQIEELAFEVLSTERLAHAMIKAGKLTARGVRRVFAVDVVKRRAFEWSRELGTWAMLATTAVLEDEALAVAVPVEALVDASVADLATVRAYRLQRHPEFVAEREEGREEGRNEGRGEMLRRQLELKFGALDPELGRLLQGASTTALDRFLARILTAETAAAVFAND